MITDFLSHFSTKSRSRLCPFPRYLTGHPMVSRRSVLLGHNAGKGFECSILVSHRTSPSNVCRLPLRVSSIYLSMSNLLSPLSTSRLFAPSAISPRLTWFTAERLSSRLHPNLKLHPTTRNCRNIVLTATVIPIADQPIRLLPKSDSRRPF